MDTIAEKWQIDEDVAKGVLARVYQVMGDWENALASAKAVYDDYSTLMTCEQWCSGFDNFLTDGCPELVWGVKYTNVSNISTCTIFNIWYNQDPSYGEGMTQGPIYSFINFFVDSKYVDLFDDTDYRGIKCEKIEGVTDEDEKMLCSGIVRIMEMLKLRLNGLIINLSIMEMLTGLQWEIHILNCL